MIRQDIYIAPSLLAANLAKLGEEAEAVLAAGADWLHFDVMDYHYVPNLTFGPCVCKALREYGIQAPIDVHLMTKPVEGLIEDFAAAGATSITFHPEATEHLDRTLQMIADHGCKAGLALNPATSLDYLEYVRGKLDIILLMSVNPGFGGQQFISQSIEKAKQVRQIINTSHKNIRLAMDGGINLSNIRSILEAGVDTVVAGTAIFNNLPKDYKKVIAKLRLEG